MPEFNMRYETLLADGKLREAIHRALNGAPNGWSDYLFALRDRFDALNMLMEYREHVAFWDYCADCALAGRTFG